MDVRKYSLIQPFPWFLQKLIEIQLNNQLSHQFWLSINFGKDIVGVIIGGAFRSPH